MRLHQNPTVFEFNMKSFTPIFRDYTPSVWLALAEKDQELLDKFSKIASALHGQTLFTYSINEDEFVKNTTEEFKLKEFPGLVIVDP